MTRSLRTLAPSYGGTGNFTIAVDPANANAPINLTYGIPNTDKWAPNYTTGFASLPIAGSTNTVPQNFRRGYIESWNLVVQRTLPAGFVGTVGYVGDHFVRQQVGTGYLNAAAFPTATSPCMPNGQYNPSTGLTGGCNFQANTIINERWCAGASSRHLLQHGRHHHSEFAALQLGIQQLADAVDA